VDVRIVCATNRDLQDMAATGDFREDLIFRVNTFEIHLPPLRERREDIPQLAKFLIARYLKKRDVPVDIISPAAMDVLVSHEWSGNVRELANALEHAVILSDGKSIQPEDFPRSITRPGSKAGGGFSVVTGSSGRSLREIEMDVIFQVLEKHDGDKPKAAEELGIALKTLYNKLNQYQARTQSKAG
jgi:DNA-binding NtrC family response regulator